MTASRFSRVLCLNGSLLLALAANCMAASDASQTYQAHIKPWMERYCFECHGPEKQKGDIRLDTLRGDFGGDEYDLWQTILELLEIEEMPPEEAEQPPEHELAHFTAWLDRTLKDSKDAQIGPSIRMLTAREYNNTLRDLLKINVSYDPSHGIPFSTGEEGFDTMAKEQVFTPEMLEESLRAAEDAIERATHFGEQPRVETQRILPTDCSGPAYRTDDYLKIVTGSSSGGWEQFHPRDKRYTPIKRGVYKLRVHATAMNTRANDGKAGAIDGAIQMAVRVGPPGQTNLEHSIREVALLDMPENRPRTYEFVTWFDDGDIPLVSFPNGHNSSWKNLVRRLYGGDARDRKGQILKNYDGPQLRVHWVEVEGPLHEQWPPLSHQAVVGKGQFDGSRGSLRDILYLFASRSFRRFATSEDLSPFMNLYDELKENQGMSDEDALKVALQAILMSPEFYYLVEVPGRLDQFALASRLSYMLWGSMPDNRLFNLAKNKRLAEPATLKGEVLRMLEDSRSDEFIHGFVEQWLNFRVLEEMPPDPSKYKVYYADDGAIENAARQETLLFIKEILHENRPVSDILDGNFTYLNEALAKHYRIKGVEGEAMQRVELPRDSSRRGLLGQASIHVVTSNGTNTTPVLRGVWVLNSILGTPSAPPPPNVEDIEPDVRGAQTIPELLAKHREIATCARCHDDIDPLGLAWENYDVIGRWRERYPQKQAVDSTANFHGNILEGVDGLRDYLLSERRQIVRGLAEKLLVYATGADLTQQELEEVEQIVKRNLASGGRFRDLIVDVCLSKTFQMH